MTRKFVISIFSVVLIVHSAICADVSQLMVDQEGNTIKLRCEEKTALFDDVVSEVALACNMATSEAQQPPSSFTEEQYWSIINYKNHPDYYLTIFRASNSTDDAMMSQMLNCTSATAQSVIVNSHDNGLSRLWLLTLTPIFFCVATMGATAAHHTVHHACDQNTASLKPAITSETSNSAVSEVELDKSIGIM